jgi:hypothetical protein
MLADWFWLLHGWLVVLLLGEMIMLMRYDSRLLRVLVCVANPSQYLPALFPLWIMPARVGNDYTTFVRVTFGRPR